MPEPGPFIQLLLARLERISVDSPLAHKASGVRGSLLRYLERLESGSPMDTIKLDRSLNAALKILRQAAAEARTGRRVGR